MSPSRRAVKPGRRYDSSGRRRQAELTRARVLDVARTALLGQGYAATTVAGIAELAEVSVETVYKTYGGKAGLVRALRDEALLGSRRVPAELRSDAMAAATADAREVVHGWVALMTEVMPRVAPVLLLVRAAAGADAEMAAVRRETEEGRLARMAHNAAHLAGRRLLRAGVGRARARDVLYTYSSPELYELLVLQRGWSVPAYARFVSEGIAAALLDPAGT